MSILFEWDYIKYSDKAPLHLAIEKKSVKIVEALLSNQNCDVNIISILKFFLNQI